jgi:hypothetical protein
MIAMGLTLAFDVRLEYITAVIRTSVVFGNAPWKLTVCTGTKEMHPKKKKTNRKRLFIHPPL